jgi:hypothetical protein
MLFDLRSSGRRRTVKTVYMTLAILMGAGLVLFGVGGAVSGGLLDVFTSNNSSSTSDVSSDLQKRARQATVAANADPKNADKWATVARRRFAVAASGNNYDPATGAFTAAGLQELRGAASAWEKSTALAGDKADLSVASIMVQVYGSLGDIDKATSTQELIAEDRNSAGAYTTLAELAYQAGQTRKGDLARDKAVSLVPADQREALRGQINDAKNAAATATATATPAATATATASPAK